jgi:cell division protein FtsL
MPTASRGKKELLEVQLEVREMERRVDDQKAIIQEREDEIARLMDKLGE